MNNTSYALSIFKYNNYLAVKVVDDDDHSKNAIYDIGKDVNSLLESIYNKY
jgi:hypothetical protein